VGLAGQQTGIYPLDSPGGWRIIGCTAVRLFDPALDPPALLSPGDQVRFVPVSSERGLSVAKILQTQGVASVQDLGRAGYQRYGVSPSGAMDWYAHRAANLLVGNPAEAAGVEVGLADQTCALSEPALAEHGLAVAALASAPRAGA